MNETGGEQSRSSDAGDMDRRVGEIIRNAGPRPALPPDVEQRLFAAARADWLSAVRSRRRRKLMYAAAAVFATVAITTLFVVWEPVRDTSLALEVTTSSGRIIVRRDGRDQSVDVGARVLSGDVLRTAPSSGAVLRRDDGLEMRVGAGAELAWGGRTARLSSGRVYVESHAAAPEDAPLTLVAGPVRIVHLGTEYLVDLSTSGPVVAVRDGAVAVSTAGDRTVVGAGKAMQLRGRVFEPVSTGAVVDWAWADALGAPLAIEGRSVDAVLVEAAQRAGVGVRYANEQTRDRARRVTLRGPPLHLAPGQAIRAVLTAGGFAGGIDGGFVVVRAR